MLILAAVLLGLAPAVTLASGAPGNAQAGEQAFAVCRACHSTASGAPAVIGPNLSGVVGRRVASAAGFDYPKDFQDLHSNKTFRYTYLQVPVVEHFRADGKGILISGQMRDPFTWEVQGNDQVCVSYPSVTRCWQYQRSKKNPEEYVRRDQKSAAMQVIKVEDGIPLF